MSAAAQSAWKTAAKIAWRESRASWGRFAFVILAVAAGVGALSGVRGFSGAFRNMLLRDARTLMAADLSVRLFHEPDARELAKLDAIVERGAKRTWITETVSMVSSPASPRPVMVAVKAVDPEVYPYYGKVELRGAASLRDAIAGGGVAVTDDLLLRLGVDIGDNVRLGDESFAIRAAILVEPDRMTGSFNVGPRLMLSRASLERSGLIQLGSRASQRYLYKMPAEGGIGIEPARKLLEEVFRPYWIADFRETHPTIRRGLDRATNFLSLVSLVAMIVGALGVAMAMHSHLQQRLDTIAILKCIGARSGQIVRIYVLQTLALGVAGSLLGILVGYGVQVWAPRLFARYFKTAPNFEWQPEVAVQALLIGVLTTLLFSLPTLLRVRTIRPALIFRRDMEQRKTLRERLRESGASLVAGALVVAGLGGVATWLGGSAELGLWFAGGLLASFLALGAVAWGLLRVLRKLPDWSPVRLPTAVRHGIANLYRPGVHAEAVLTALGIGVTFTLSVYLIQTSVLDQMLRSAPPDMPNVFLVNVTGAEKDGLTRFLEGYPGVEKVELTPSIAARLETVDGRPLADLNLGERSRYSETRGISWLDRQPDEIHVLRGSWWSGQDGRSLVAVREDVAADLGVDPGSKLAWLVGRRTVEAEVAAVFRAESIRPGSANDFVLNEAALVDAPAVYYGGARIAPERAVELQRQAFERFPTVLAINAADVIGIVQEVVDQIAIVVQFVSAFAILGGVIILTSSVVATRFRRVRETAILKTLGATRSKVARIFSVEFLVLGLVAGTMGALLASAFSAFLLDRVLDAEYEWAVLPSLVTIAATAAIVNVAGWMASFRILGQKPLEVLRHE